jgi:hypothetical protein
VRKHVRALRFAHNAEKGGRFATPPMAFRVMAWPRLISLTEKAPLLRKAQKWATRGTLQRGMNSSARTAESVTCVDQLE